MIKDCNQKPSENRHLSQDSREKRGQTDQWDSVSAENIPDHATPRPRCAGDGVMGVPYLTEVRWHCLQAFKRQPALMRRPFLAKELKLPARWNDAILRPATGPTLSGLEKAGWVRRAIWGLPGTGMPFQSGGPISAWELTDAGREAVAACPDTFPGVPVYGERTTHD